jgi:hypothetical protein
MLIFDPENPFPLMSEESHSYAEAKRHSSEVDAWVGLDTAKVESVIGGRELGQDQNHWIGLAPEILMTPYTELRAMLSRLNLSGGETMVDLGAGYGRMGFIIGRHYPDSRFIGYEVIGERVEESVRCLRRFGFPNVEMLTQDLFHPDFKPVSAEYYFLYDYGSRAAIGKTLEDLREIAGERSITVIGRGRAVRDAIERRHPWLSQVRPPEHYAHYSIYRS